MSTFHQQPIPEVSVEEVGAGSLGAVLLDVREAKEWNAGHAPNAVWIPLGELENARFQLPMNQPVQCICRSGVRSARAAEALISWGFDAANVAGGMKAWAAAGLPVVTDDGSPGTVA